MDVKLVGLQAEHIDQIVEIEKISFPTPWSKKSLLHELHDNPFAFYVVAVSGREVLAYGGVWLVMDEAHVTNVAVNIPYRGKGLGRLIMDELQFIARAQGCMKITLEVRTSNLIAQGLYNSLGFRAAGLRKGYYSDTKEDAIIMWKDL